MAALQPLIASLPPGYRIEMGGSIEEAGKANAALAKIFPAMIAATLIVIMLQVRSFSTSAGARKQAHPDSLVRAAPCVAISHQLSADPVPIVPPSSRIAQVRDARADNTLTSGFVA